MDMQLAGKSALVTGSTSGLGVAIAQCLAREGVAVAINGRNEERARQTVESIELDGGRAVAAVGDLATDDGAERVAKSALAQLGTIDILVNNAGGSLLSGTNPPWQDITPDNYLASFNVNVVAAIRLIRLLVPAMVERNWGRIINISSTAARQALGALHDYGPAKAGIENFGLNLSRNVSPDGVTVNTIAPGLIMTPGSEEFLIKLGEMNGWSKDLEEIQRRYATEVYPQSILRLGKPAEIGAAVTFLASPLSDYTTGAMLRVDGGTSIAL